MPAHQFASRPRRSPRAPDTASSAAGGMHGECGIPIGAQGMLEEAPDATARVACPDPSLLEGDVVGELPRGDGEDRVTTGLRGDRRSLKQTGSVALHDDESPPSVSPLDQLPAPRQRQREESEGPQASIREVTIDKPRLEVGKKAQVAFRLDQPVSTDTVVGIQRAGPVNVPSSVVIPARTAQVVIEIQPFETDTVEAASVEGKIGQEARSAAFKVVPVIGSGYAYAQAAYDILQDRYALCCLGYSYSYNSDNFGFAEGSKNLFEALQYAGRSYPQPQTVPSPLADMFGQALLALVKLRIAKMWFDAFYADTKSITAFTLKDATDMGIDRMQRAVAIYEEHLAM